MDSHCFLNLRAYGCKFNGFNYVNKLADDELTAYVTVKSWTLFDVLRLRFVHVLFTHVKPVKRTVKVIFSYN